MIIIYFLVAFIATAYGAVITSPNNIICFPERDYCSLEGFTNLVGQRVLVEVNRNGVIIGSASGAITGNIVALDINHPGGICWGDGTTLKVTPDIQPGDLVSVKSGALLLGDMTVSNGYIRTYSLSGTTLTISGYVDVSVISSNIEIRIVNTLLLNTIVAKKQINAILGPLVANVGYSSGLEITGTTFTATFVFTSQDVANIAGSGVGYAMSMWQENAPNGARQGLTIHEHGATGGPFSVACPLGPSSLTSPIVHAMAISNNLIKWAPVQDIVGGPVTSGYSVNLLRGNQVYGYRLLKTDNQINFNLVPIISGDIIEIRTMSGTKMSDSYRLTYQPTTLVPTITSIPVNNPNTDVSTEMIVLTSNTGQIIYTLDGSPVLDINNQISPSALLYYAPIRVTQALTLKAMSFDNTGSFSQELIGKYVPQQIPLPQAIALAPTAVVVNGGITLSWTKPADNSITGFGVDIFTSTGVKIGTTRTTTTTTMIITNLTPGLSYQFSVMSQNVAGFSSPSPKTGTIVFPSPVDTITITSAKYVANKQFKISGTGSIAATAMVYSVNVNGGLGTPIFNRGTTSVISAPIACAAGVCTFNIDIRNGAVPLTRPSSIYIVSTKGGVAGPFVVA